MKKNPSSLSDNRTAYGIIEEKYTINDVCRTSYGIAAYSDNSSEGTVTVTNSVHDLSSDRQIIENLVQTCNRLSLDPEQLQDIAYDFLNE